MTGDPQQQLLGVCWEPPPSFSPHAYKPAPCFLAGGLQCSSAPSAGGAVVVVLTTEC